MHLLVVEDDASLRESWVAVLSAQGFSVKATADASEAMAALTRTADLSLVLLDLGLPPSPGDPTVGLDLLRRLLVAKQSLKVIVLTGQDEPAICWQAIALGAFDYLLKPASRAQVLQALQRACLFLDAEAKLAESGQARITVTAPLLEGVREFGDAAQERLVRAVMSDTQHNVAEAARRLGLSREHLYYFIRKFGIERPSL
ncbi:MAG: response regulator [Ramlibacter sp.]|nr:response regulator [Ramlibacter sp.]